MDRPGWELCVSPDGQERDEYDAAGTQYLVIRDKGRHDGSCRVRPVSQGTMLLDHFGQVFPEAAGSIARQSGRLYELTRFCRVPDASPSEARTMLADLAELLDGFRDDHGITGYLAVVYPEIGRFLNRIGVRYIRLAVSEITGREAHLICITHCVTAQRLSERRRAIERAGAHMYGAELDRVAA